MCREIMTTGAEIYMKAFIVPVAKRKSVEWIVEGKTPVQYNEKVIKCMCIFQKFSPRFSHSIQTNSCAKLCSAVFLIQLSAVHVSV